MARSAFVSCPTGKMDSASATTAATPSATRSMIAASAAPARSRVITPAYDRTSVAGTTTTSEGRAAMILGASGVAAIRSCSAHQPPRKLLYSRISRLRASPNRTRHLLRESNALLRYRRSNRRAARDPIDQKPQVLALQQLCDGSVDELAVDHARQHALSLWAVERGGEDALELRPLEQPRRDVVRDTGGEQALEYRVAREVTRHCLDK